MKILKQVSLKNYCSYKTGGQAENIYFPQSVEEIIEIVSWHYKTNKAFWLHGRGANTIFPDNGVKFSIISTQELKKQSIVGNRVWAQAGVVLDKLVAATVKAGLAGMEKLSGIPGSIGGGLHMNAGAFGGEISDCLHSLKVYTLSGEVKDIAAAECGFSYRSCGCISDYLILEAVWELKIEDARHLHQERSDILSKRREKQPLDSPSAGSVFKRPQGSYASLLVDKAGLKGRKVGDAQVSDKHAGFIVNCGQASSKDILDLVEICQKEVKNKFGYDLELEQCICNIDSACKV